MDEKIICDICFINLNKIDEQCGQNIMGPKHHLKAQKHQPKTPPKNLKKHHFLGKKHHIFFKNLSKMTLPWIFIAFLCINFWKIFTVKLKFSKNFKISLSTFENNLIILNWVIIFKKCSHEVAFYAFLYKKIENV